MKGFCHVYSHFDPGLFGMALLRLLSSLVECTAALLMLYFNDVKKALVINSLLAVIGPLIFIMTTAVGLIAVAGSLSYGKLLLICLGVALILIGILK